MHACFFTPGPPNLGLSLQKTQVPQSSVRRQAGQSMQRTPLFRSGCPPGEAVNGVSNSERRGVVFLEGTRGRCDWRTTDSGVLAGVAEGSSSSSFTGSPSSPLSCCSAAVCDSESAITRPLLPSSLAILLAPLPLASSFFTSLDNRSCSGSVQEYAGSTAPATRERRERKCVVRARA